MKSHSIIIIPLTFLLCSVSAKGQHDQADSTFFEVLTAYSPQSAFFLGKTRDTQTIFSYLGYGKKVNPSFISLQTYRTFGLIPYAKYYYPKRDDGDRRDTAIGFGISPLGYLFMKPLNGKNKAIFSIKSGIMYMEKTFPTDKARRLNYTFDLSVAFQHFVLPETSVSLGYKFHHISNAQTGKQNPGIDSNFIFITLKQFTNGHKSSN